MRLLPTLCGLSILSAVAVTTAIAAEDVRVTVTEGNALSEAPTKWLGETPHLVIMGTVEGFAFDVQYPDIGSAGGVAGFEAKREYLPTDGGFLYADFEFELQAVIAGQEKTLELEFENRDFAEHPLPARFELQDEEFPDGLYSNMEMEFEWEQAGVSVNQEVEDWNGTLTLLTDTGDAEKNGLVGNGMIGGFVVADRGADRIVISFTVPVTEYEIDD